ncbi:DUF1289 domain-containing protein [Azospirillum doebereinerae]|uniref:DUF1289 domain-containing protein n=1 Tax=Azospirillum doebereinerae TaxID=92933 RepID=A0A3S0X8M5_9PROT|nr:DUF1289 domain-containing protein [Azospirillum doebereinerae]RUQ66346.1 DUF1289 domain-containing protein [Azospirillum doebereinerae]
MSTKDTRNPCIGACRFGADAECRGCHRTKAEVKGWKRLSDGEKAAINHRIQAQAALETKPSDGKRLRKLDRKIRKLEAKLSALKAERETSAGAALSRAPPEGGIVPLRSTTLRR